MKFKPKKFLSLLTASLLAAGGLVGIAAAPASATPTVETFTGWTAIQNFGGNTSSVEASPPSGLANGDAMKVVKGWETWAGTTFKSLSGREFISLASAQDSESITASVYVPLNYGGSNGKIRLKLEDAADTNIFVEADFAISSQTTGWQQATWTFNGQMAGFSQANTYNKASIFMDFGVVNSGSIWYVDNFSYNAHALQGAPSQTNHPVILSTFESSDTNAYDASAVCSSAAEITNTPPSGGASGSLISAKVRFQGGGCDAFPLWTFLSLPSGQSLVSTAHNIVSMNFYSPTGGETPLLKFNTGPNNAGPLPAYANEAVVAGWQTLTFTFSGVNDAASYRLATFFPQGDNFTTVKTGAYYFDDVAFNGATTPAVTLGGVATPQVDYDVRLLPELKTNTNELTNCGWANCSVNKYYFKMLEARSVTSLQHGTTNVVAGASVKLRLNISYSGSNATWTTSNGAVGTVGTGAGPDGGYVTATTNNLGIATFVVTNTNDSGEAPRALNDSTDPYPAPCSSPVGQTKGAFQPEVLFGNGINPGDQFVDVLYPHVYSSVINTAIAAGSSAAELGISCGGSSDAAPAAAPVSPYDMGRYPHLRLEKSLLNNKFDASWWDGVWQFRDADTQAYLKYIPVGSTFSLTYVVTDENSLPLANAPVSLIVNANYSCSKTFFAYEGSLIGPDDCAGGGETELPAKKTDSNGRVTFVLTNTNTTGEAMPADLNGLPNGKELGTNIKPNLVGAKRQGIDMLFAHFVESSDASKVSGPGTVSAVIGTGHSSTFTFLDAAGKALAKTDIKYYVNGFDSKIGFAVTDAQGRVTIRSTNSSGQAGMQTVGVSLDRDGKLPLFATATINWDAPALAVSAAGSKGAVVVKVAGAAGKTVKFTIAGKVYTRVAKSQNAEFSFATTAGKKAVKVSVAGKTLSKSVTVTKK